MKNENNMPRIDREIYLRFKAVAAQNGRSADDVLSTFMKDYIVSGGHPERVRGGQPWNRKE